MRAPSVLVSLAGATLVWIGAARAEIRSHLEGDLRPVATTAAPGEHAQLFNVPGEPAGTFVLDAAAPELDFRSAPGTLTLATAAGSLVAQTTDPPTLYDAIRYDLDSKRPLKSDAPEGATCPTGVEPDCWMEGDPLPLDAAVSAALEPFTSAFDSGPQLALLDPASGVASGIDASGMAGSVLVQAWPASATTAIRERVIDPSLGSTSSVRNGVVSAGGAQFARRDFVSERAPLQELGSIVGFCSIVTPQYCSSLWDLILFATQLLDDDPTAPPTQRSIAESGALYQVTEATGDLAPYAGGTVHVLGLERARNHVAQLGIPLVLFPAGAMLDLSAPFAAPTPQALGTPTFGLAYATAPEPVASLSVLAAWIALAASWRHPRR